MTKFFAKLTAGVATVGLVVSVLSPAAFASSVTVAGNGAFSHSGVVLTSISSNKLKQSNNSVVINDVDSKADSGHNNASFNTGGSSSIMTGPATSSVVVSNTGGTNTASGSPCGCPTDPTIVKIKNNGAFSNNGVVVTTVNSNTASQSNKSFVVNDVDSKADTGHNNSSFNTHGTTDVTTGSADSSVVVVNGGSSNTL